MNCKLKYGDLLNCAPASLRTPSFTGKLTYSDRPDNCRFRISHEHFIFGIVDNIWDYNSDTYYKEYDIVTGHGEKNSNVLIGYKLILDDFTITNEIYYSNPHDVYYWSDRIDNLIVSIENDLLYAKNINSIKNKFNREEKLNRILDEK